MAALDAAPRGMRAAPDTRTRQGMLGQLASRLDPFLTFVAAGTIGWAVGLGYLVAHFM